MSSNITVTTGNAVTNITVTSGTQNVFRTIATDSGSAVTDSTTDILTFTGAGGLTTSADSGTDTVTFTQGAPNISSNSVGQLSDVDITTSAPTTNQVLLFNSTSNKFVPGNVSDGAGYQSTNLLNDLDDVTMSSTSEGQILVFDASAPTQFVNRNLSGAVTLDGDGVTAINSNQVGTTQLDLDNIDISDFANITANVNVLNDKYIFNAHGNIGIGFFDNKLQLSTTELAGDLTFSGTHDIGTSGVRVDNIFVNNLNASGTITGIDISDLTDTGGLLQADNLSNNTTDDLAEGSSNQYFTTSRARASISASGSLSYDNSTGAMTYTQGAIDADSVTVSNLEVDNLKATTLVTESEGIASNDNDTTLPTSAAVKDYVDGQILTKDNTDEITEGSTNLYFTDARARAVSIENVVEDTTPQLGGTLDILTHDIKSSSANVVISADANDKDIILKVKDSSGTLNQAAHFNTLTAKINSTDGDLSTEASVLEPVMDIPKGIRIGTTGTGLSSTGALTANNNAGDWATTGVTISNGDRDQWPELTLISYGGANPLKNSDFDHTGDGVADDGTTVFGGVFNTFPNAGVVLKAAGGTESSPSALASGKRLGVLGFMGHDGDGFGGTGAISSASLTCESAETFSNSNARGVKLVFDVLPTGGSASDGNGSSDRRHQLTMTGSTVQIGNENHDDKYAVVDSSAGELQLKDLKITSLSNADIDIEPNGTGDVLLGNFKFDADQTVGASQDNMVLTYDNSTGKISLEAASGGGGSGISNVVEDTSPQLGGALDVNGQDITGSSVSIVTTSNGNISLAPNGNGKIKIPDDTRLLFGGDEDVEMKFENGDTQFKQTIYGNYELRASDAGASNKGNVLIRSDTKMEFRAGTDQDSKGDLLITAFDDFQFRKNGYASSETDVAPTTNSTTTVTLSRSLTAGELKSLSESNLYFFEGDPSSSSSSGGLRDMSKYIEITGTSGSGSSTTITLDSAVSNLSDATHSAAKYLHHNVNSTAIVVDGTRGRLEDKFLIIQNRAGFEGPQGCSLIFESVEFHDGDETHGTGVGIDDEGTERPVKYELFTEANKNTLKLNHTLTTNDSDTTATVLEVRNRTTTSSTVASKNAPEVVEFHMNPQVQSFTKSQLDALTGRTGEIAMCSNGNAGNPCLAFYSGSSWLNASGAALTTS